MSGYKEIALKESCFHPGSSLCPGCMEAIEAAEKMYMGEMMKTQDAAEGLKAFLEKRPPVWAHR